jgi:hypothetical protein
MATTTRPSTSAGPAAGPTAGGPNRWGSLAAQLDRAVVLIALGGAALSLLKGDLLGLVGCLAVAGYFSYRTSRRAATVFTALWNRWSPWKLGRGSRGDGVERPGNGKRSNGVQ